MVTVLVTERFATAFVLLPDGVAVVAGIVFVPVVLVTAQACAKVV